MIPQRNKIVGMIQWTKQHIILIFMMIIVSIFIYFKIILSYINTQATIMNTKKPLKIVVFDLDETIGYFTELGIFWEALEKFYGHNLFDDNFFELMDIFPEYLRPNIIKILDIIHSKKTCHKVILYTNNQGPKSWVKMICDYFNKKLGYTVFNTIIAAYKVNGKQIEPKRTSHDKSVNDLFNCSNLPSNTEVCFIDDLYHPLMDKDNVFYINIKPYRYSMPYNEMASRYYNRILIKKNSDITEIKFVNFIVSYMERFNYMVIKKTKEEENTDIVVSKKLLSHLEDFLKRDRITTTRKKRNRRTKTMRQEHK